MRSITWRPGEYSPKGKKNLRLTLKVFCYSAVSCTAFAGAERSRWHQTESKKPKESPGHHLCLPQLVHSPGTNGRGKLCRMPWPNVLCTIPDRCWLCCEMMHVKVKAVNNGVLQILLLVFFKVLFLHPPSASTRSGTGLARPRSPRLLVHWLFPTPC